MMLVLAHLHPAFAQGTAFMYQGQLVSGGELANGSFDITFTLFATNNGGSVIAGPVTNSATSVTNGLFTAMVDFGAGVFTGSNYWLELAVQTNGGSGFTTLTPRQPIMPTPYAIYAPNAGIAASAATAGTASSVSAANISGILSAGQLPFTNALVTPAIGPNLAATFTTNANGTVSMTLNGITATQLAAMMQAAGVLTNGNVSISGNLAIPSTNGIFQISSGSTAFNIFVRTNIPTVPVAVLQPTNNLSSMVLDLMPMDTTSGNPAPTTNQLGTGIVWIHLVNRDLTHAKDPGNWNALALIQTGFNSTIQTMSSGTNTQGALTINASVLNFQTAGINRSAVNTTTWYFGNANQVAINLASGLITGPNLTIRTNISTGTLTAFNGVILPPQTSGPIWSQIGTSNTVVLWSSNNIPPNVWKSYFDVNSNRVDSVVF